MSRYTDWTNGEPIEKEWPMTGPTDPALRAPDDLYAHARAWVYAVEQGLDDEADEARRDLIAHALAQGRDDAVERVRKLRDAPMSGSLAGAYRAAFQQAIDALAAAEAAPLDVEQALWDKWTSGEKLAYGIGFRRGAALRSPDTETER